MKHIFRFFGTRQSDKLWSIDPNEMHQILNVLKYQVGDQLELTNGQGNWCLADVVKISKKSIEISVVNEGLEVVPKHRLALCVGALKASSWPDLIPGLVELGVDSIFVFGQEGTDRNLLSERVRAKLEKLVYEGCKVAKRSIVPSIFFFESLDQLVSQLKIDSNLVAEDFRGIVFEKDSEDLIANIGIEGRDIVAVVGSERGLLEPELLLLKSHKFRFCRLSKHTLRSVTAALAACACVRASMQPC